MTVSFDVRRGRRHAVVAPKGELDFLTSAPLDEQLSGLLDDGCIHVTVDLSDVTFIDANTLTVLVRALRRAREVGGDVELRSPTPLVSRVIKITELDNLFRIRH